MLSLTGQLVNTIEASAPLPDQQREPKPRIQILGDVSSPDGSVRKDLVTVSVRKEDFHNYTGRVGDTVTLPVGAFSPSKGQVIYFGV